MTVARVVGSPLIFPTSIIPGISLTGFFYFWGIARRRVDELTALPFEKK